MEGVQSGIPRSGIASGVPRASLASNTAAWVGGCLEMACVPVNLNSVPEVVDLGFLYLTWALVKHKSSSKVMDQNMKPRGKRYILGLLGKLKRVLWVVEGVLPGVHRTSLTFHKAAGAVGPSIEHREGV